MEPDVVKKTVQELKRKQTEAFADVQKYKNAIEAMQAICPHKHTEYVSGHHSSTGCLDCGKQDI